ncbi:MAG: HAMP domain-containing histidine kinase [Burkholderiaceae bacterium]|nr:HAMP domain-containing histidine kinase [Burkholderiaceae bacterium]
MTQPAAPGLTAHPDAESSQSVQLEEAFRLFLQASQELETQQSLLQGQVNRLSEDLAAANQRLAALLEALPAGVLVIEEGRVRDLNPAAKSLLPDLHEGSAWKIPSSWSPTPVQGEYQTTTDSSSRTVQVKEVGFGDRKILQIQDITESLTQHAETQRQSKLASMGQMAASIAHQLRTPLATATLYAGHLTDPLLPAERQRDMAEKLRRQLSSLEKLTTRMLQFVRQRPQKTESVLISDLLDEAEQAIRPVCERYGVPLEVSLKGEPSLVSVERDAIVSALVAVLENALQVSPQGSVIRMQATVEPARVRISIDDQGPGIEESMLHSMFEPFTTSRVNGTGLGLSIARNAIEAHRGEINASNRPDGGARFMLSLPCMPSL